MFGRAAITLGFGPPSSFLLIYILIIIYGRPM